MKRDVLDLAESVASIPRHKKFLGHDYPSELSAEAMVKLHALGASAELMDHVHWMVQRVGMKPEIAVPWRSQQFHNLEYPYYSAVGKMDAFRDAFVKETERWVKEAPRNRSGALVHNCMHDPAGTLIDMVQAYLIRLVRASVLTGDEKWAEIGVTEMERHATDLRDEKSRCYHQGRGWLPNDKRSPGCWSRGQGWVLHGFITALPLLAKGSDLETRLLALYRDLVDALLPLQTKSGLWLQLIDYDKNSCADTSGSAFIYEALEIGLQAKYLQGDKYRKCAELAWAGLLTQVDPSGLVGGVSMGPGPIWEIEPWQKLPGLTGDVHGIFTMLFACGARASRLAGSES